MCVSVCVIEREKGGLNGTWIRRSSETVEIENLFSGNPLHKYSRPPISQYTHRNIIIDHFCCCCYQSPLSFSVPYTPDQFVRVTWQFPMLMIAHNFHTHKHEIWTHLWHDGKYHHLFKCRYARNIFILHSLHMSSFSYCIALNISCSYTFG